MDVLERIPNREQRLQVEATYWTWRVLGVFPDGTSDAMKRLVGMVDEANRREVVTGDAVAA